MHIEISVVLTVEGLAPTRHIVSLLPWTAVVYSFIYLFLEGPDFRTS